MVCMEQALSIQCTDPGTMDWSLVQLQLPRTTLTWTLVRELEEQQATHPPKVAMVFSIHTNSSSTLQSIRLAFTPSIMAPLSLLLLKLHFNQVCSLLDLTMLFCCKNAWTHCPPDSFNLCLVGRKLYITWGVVYAVTSVGQVLILGQFALLCHRRDHGSACTNTSSLRLLSQWSREIHNFSSVLKYLWPNHGYLSTSLLRLMHVAFGLLNWIRSPP